MRFFDSLFGGISLERTPLLSGRSLATRALITGLPLFLAVFLLASFFAGRSVNKEVQSAISRSALLQAEAVSFALENVLRETRNQLLILAAGAVNEQNLERAFKARAERDGENFREVAFVGLTPEDRFLLINHKGQIIKVPTNAAREAPGGPFQTGGQLPQGHVSLSRPLEVSYAMVPVNGDLENIAFHILRFSTPVHDEAGKFLGVLSLALDLGVLRDRLTLFQNMGYGMQSFFFDNDGWLMFQAGDEPGAPLSSDQARSGFRGDFGRPGFSRAFRPAPEHLNYWTMVADVQGGNSGLMPMPIKASTEDPDFLYAGGASYAPVSWQGDENESGRPLGGIALLNDSLVSPDAWQRLIGIYINALLTAAFVAAFCVWFVIRFVSRPLNFLTARINECNAENCARRIVQPRLPRELEELKSGINGLLERLQQARESANANAEARSQRWLRQPASILPVKPSSSGPCLVGTSPAMRSLLSQIEKAAKIKADILIVGETGTGKELVASSIHNLSNSNGGPFISINCGALDEALLMDTLFGHVKGAFTEAKTERKGAFLAATGGTLLLDEIGNATSRVQQALLRALSTRHIRPLGSDSDVAFNTRIIAATNSPLKDNGAEFRSDLYYRLAVITLNTPPLRDHKEDIPDLVGYFIASLASGLDRKPGISRGALEKLVNYDWPGNVRELRNVIIRALAFCDNSLIMAEDLPIAGVSTSISEPAISCSGPLSFTHSSCSELNKRQAEMWRRLIPLGKFTRLEYERMAAGAISPRTAQYDLKLMLKLGLLRREGKGPSQSYVVVGEAALIREKY